jgi:hypothetical protein
MRRFLLALGTIVGAVLFLPNQAYAVCQTCNNDNTLSAMCWTLNMCDSGATMGACVVKEMFDQKTGQVTNRYCDSMGSQPGPECNGADPSCHSPGPGAGDPGPGPGGGGGDCDIAMGDVCPAQCAVCTVNLDCWC